MADDLKLQNIPVAYVPFFLAWDCNMLPDQLGKHEVEDLGSGRVMVLLASHNITSNILIIVDQS